MSRVTGPIPKAHRVGHPHGPKDHEEPSAIRERKPVKPPDTPDYWHPTARGWFNALKMSPLAAEDFTASDFMEAYIAAELLDEGCSNRWTAATITAFGRISERLGTCIGDRRRMRIELKRAGIDEDEAGAVQDISDWQRRLSAVPSEGNDSA